MKPTTLLVYFIGYSVVKFYVFRGLEDLSTIFSFYQVYDVRRLFSEQWQEGDVRNVEIKHQYGTRTEVFRTRSTEDIFEGKSHIIPVHKLSK